jgi:hypothetical protein
MALVCYEQYQAWQGSCCWMFLTALFKMAKDHAPQNEVFSCVMQPNPQNDRKFSIKSAMSYGTSMVHGLGC